jgi:hypothetical protein
VRVLPLAVVASLLLAGCSAGGSGASGPISHPAGATTVLRVDYRGGFVPADVRLTQLPAFLLLGDGRVIQPGAQAAIYPGPLLPALEVRTLSETGVQAVLRQALATGLFDGDRTFDGARSRVMDAPDTVFTLEADGRRTTVSVYALGETDLGSSSGLSADEMAARRSLVALNQRLGSLDAWLPAGSWAVPRSSGFTADAYRLFIHNADGDKGEAGIGIGLVAWPSGQDPASVGLPFGDGRCWVVRGPDARTWGDVLAKANQLTRWTFGGHRYRVLPRPLLPGEPAGCAGG